MHVGDRSIRHSQGKSDHERFMGSGITGSKHLAGVQGPGWWDVFVLVVVVAAVVVMMVVVVVVVTVVIVAVALMSSFALMP